MRVREVDPEEHDASESIDNVMLTWQKQAGGAWEQDLRQKLGGPSDSASSSDQATSGPEDPVAASAPPPPPTLAPSRDLSSYDPWDPGRPVPGNGNGNGNGNGHAHGADHREPQAAPSSVTQPQEVAKLPDAEREIDDRVDEPSVPLHRAHGHHPAISHRAKSKKHRRSNKQWKKGSKARRR